MGQKVHPIGFRLGVVKGWQSRWFAEKEYKHIYAEDVKIRELILKNKDFNNAGISRIEIERTAADQVTVFIHTAKPGIVIGRNGDKVEKLKNALQAATKKRVVKVDIKEIRNPELDAILVGQSIAEQLEKRVSFRRAMKQAVQKSMRANAKGIKVIVGGRLGGAEIARSEKEVEGKVPLHTLRADIDYGQAEAHTTYGVIGIKVWIYRGEILPTKRREIGEPETTSVQPAYVTREGGQRGDRRGGGQQRGERGQRPPYRGGDRPQGGQRFQGDRRQQGDRPMGGERPARPPRPGQGQGQGGPRPPRPQQGERAPRTPREQQPRNQAPDTAVSTPAPEAQNPESSATQSE